MLLEKLLSTDQKIKDTPNNPRPDYESSWGYKTTSGERVSVETSKSIATLYRAKNIISDDIAKMPFQQFRRNGKNIEQVQPDPITRNYAYLLQVSPNLWGWSPFEFKKLAAEWLIFYGNTYIWSPIIGPRQLLILPADKTVPVFALDGSLWYQHTFSNNKTVFIPAVEILHLMINPDTSGFIGRGVITYARDTFGRRIAANKTQGKLFAQGFMPAAYVTVNGELDKEARKIYRDSYAEAMSGSENAYSLAVFDNRITKFEPINIQMRDQQFLEGIGATDVDICNFCGLPTYKINQGKQSYESNEQQNLDYLNTTIDPYLVNWEEKAHISWLTIQEQKNNYFKFIREALLRMSAKARADKYAVEIENGMLTPNEAIEKEDRNGYGTEGDRHYMMSTVQAIGIPVQIQPSTPSQTSSKPPSQPPPNSKKQNPEDEQSQEEGEED